MNAKQNSAATDLTVRPLFKKIILFTLPLMLTGILQLLYNATDIIVLGHFASDASAGAVGSTGALVNLVTTLFIGLSVGSASVAARYIGAQDDEKLFKVIHTSISVALITGLFLGVIAVSLTKYFLIAMKVPDSILGLSTLYLRIYFAGMPFSFVYNFGSALLRAQGDTKRPLIALFLSGLINVALNLTLVIGCKMDVAGVGIGTVVAQAVAAVLVIIFLVKQKGARKLYLSKLRIDLPVLKEILNIGLPAGFEGVIFALSNVVIQAAVNSFGDVVITANAEAANIEGFIFISMNAVTQSCITFSGQNYGAGKLKNIDVTLINCLSIVVVLGLTLGVTTYFIGDYVMRIFTKNPEITALAKQRFAVICTTYFLCGIMDVLVSGMRGVGCSFTPMVVSLVGVCAFRIIYIYTIFKVYRNLTVLYLSYPISWIITIAAHVVMIIIIRKKTYSRFNAALNRQNG